jgi:uncharacterized flavoprotein (TIGR03862 family)
MNEVAVVGAGPAGLFSAECLLERGFSVSLYDRMPSAGCKLLVAGNRGGLNITNAASPEEFSSRYGESAARFASYLSDFSPANLEAWLAGLGVSVRRGSGGKIFPDVVTPAELLARWMARLEARPGFSFHAGWTFSGFGEASRAAGGCPTLLFEVDGATVERTCRAAVFALGGASWPQTGSDGSWTECFGKLGVSSSPFLPANCGFEADWPELLQKKFANVPLKNISLSVRGLRARGEAMLTPYGIEGGVVYTLGAAIRDAILREGSCEVSVDFLPDWTLGKISDRLAGGPGTDSVTNWLRKRLGLASEAMLLLREAAMHRGVELRDANATASLAKAAPILLYRPRPIAEAISSAGGVRFSGLDENLMLKELPGVFCAGEMLDWEAPTGGFLLQGCFSTAFRAARGAAEWLARGTE